MPEVNDDQSPEPPRDDTAGWISGSSGTEDDDLCPQAKVPCERNAFDMCRYCGRDLSGNPDA